MTASEKSNMIYELLDLLRTNKLNDIQKSNIDENFSIIENILKEYHNKDTQK